MSKIALSGNASGTGTLTIAAPNTNTDRTLTLPDNTGTVVTTGSTAGVSQAMLASGVAGTGPAFSAYQSSAQTLTAGTTTVLQFQTKLYDTTSAYNTSTYQYQPLTAGYYLVSTAVRMPASSTRFILEIRKNTTIVKSIQDVTALYATSGSAIIYMNGTTDYLDVTLYTGSTGGLAASAPNTYFEAALIRSA